MDCEETVGSTILLSMQRCGTVSVIMYNLNPDAKHGRTLRSTIAWFNYPKKISSKAKPQVYTEYMV
jgi:hypothetical protein